MASANSKVAKVTTTESGAFGSKRNVDNYYKTEVTTLGDGSIKRETFRTDAQGNNGVKVQEVSVDKDGKISSNEISSNATSAERRDLNNSDSQLRNSIRTQTEDASEQVIKNETEAAAGGQTSIGKKNAEVVAGGSGNNAGNDNSESDTKPAALQAEAATDGTRTSFPNLRYPINVAIRNKILLNLTCTNMYHQKLQPVVLVNLVSLEENWDHQLGQLFFQYLVELVIKIKQIGDQTQ